MTFSYVANADCIHDAETGAMLTREAVSRLLDRWQHHHDELLRVRSDDARMAARKVRKAFLDLDDARPDHWNEAEVTSIPVLQPITLRVAKTAWLAVPGEAA